ncbi:hypothetical protein ACTQ4E_16605, partial [Lawsonibacter sp. LCP25S3_G6]
TDGRRFTPFGMERLRRLRWNGRTVPPERALRLTGIRNSIPDLVKNTGRIISRETRKSPFGSLFGKK